MLNFYDVNIPYTSAKKAELNAIEPNLSAVLEIRQNYKILVGRALRSFLSFHNAGEFCCEDTIACWCAIANDSHLFNEDVHMIQCILDETIRPNEPCIPLSLRRKTAESKGDFNDLIRICRHEAHTIKQLYARVGKFDPAYDSKKEYRKIRKALLFIKIAICASLYSKLPSKLTQDEYTTLCTLSKRPNLPVERYRYDPDEKMYQRIGGFPKARPYKLFGILGCTVFIRKSIHRYETMLEPFIS